MKKRGISQVVTTLLFVLIALGAVLLVWNLVRGIITQSSEDINVQEVTTNLEVVQNSLILNGDGTGSVVIKRGAGSGELTGVSLVISDGVESKTIQKDVVIGELESKKVDFEYNGIVKEISVAPVFTGDDGKKKIGQILDTAVYTNKNVLKTSGAVAYWKLDGDVDDEIGSANGVLMGGTDCSVDGKFGKGCEFDGLNSNDYINVNDESVYLTGDKTIVAWIKLSAPLIPPNPATNWEIIDAERISNNGFIFRIDGATQRLYYRNSWVAGYGADYSTGIITNNEWYQVAVSYSAINRVPSFYINGEDAGALNNMINNNVIPERFAIGGGSWTPQKFDGIIDELMIFDRALSAEEIKGLYNLDLS